MQAAKILEFYFFCLEGFCSSRHSWTSRDQFSHPCPFPRTPVLLQSGHKKGGRLQGRLGLLSVGTGSAMDPSPSPFFLDQPLDTVNQVSRAQGTSLRKMHSSFQNDIRTSTMGINNRCQEQLLTISSSSFKHILCGETEGFQSCFGLECSGPFPVFSYGSSFGVPGLSQEVGHREATDGSEEKPQLLNSCSCFETAFGSSLLSF